MGNDPVEAYRVSAGYAAAPEGPFYPHGTVRRYDVERCRCDACKNAWRLEAKRRRAERHERLLADPSLAEHGKSSTYTNWECRCIPCTQAHSTQRWERKQAKRAGLTLTQWRQQKQDGRD